jgi:FHS family L-fucose permease-like MFS transporter
MAGITTTTPKKSNQDPSTEFDVTKSYAGPLIIVTMLFFMWGFITCMNDILIPKMQQVFTLQDWQAMLVQSAFFGAYFFISLAYYIVSVTKGDPISKIGYKNGIIVGLVVAAIGCALFFPAAGMESYAFFLLALFILASGITVLQIAANPYVTILGPARGASSRLNMTQAFNSFGTTIAPVIGGYLIFEAGSAVSTGAESVKVPYLGLAATLLVIAVAFKLFKLPKVSGEGDIVSGSGALQYSHLVLGIICIFAYVGGEVAIGSAFINFVKLPHIAGLEEAEASYLLAFFWGGAMIGRFFGAVALADFKNNLYRYLIIGLIAAITFLAVYSIYGADLALITLGLVVVNIVVLLLGQFIPSRTLGLFALSVIILLLLGIFTQGELAMWSIIAIGLFNSIMFPTIFALAIKGLGKYTSQASSLLVMAIVGGAIIPPLQGLFADISGDRQLSFVVPLLCYIYIAYYGLAGYKPKGPVEAEA